MTDFDFIPASYHDAVRRQRTLRSRGLFITCMVAIMGLWLASHRQELAQADQMFDEVVQQESQIRVHQLKKEMLMKEGEALKDRQRLVEELGRHSSLVVTFADISRRMPETVLLTRVELQEPSIIQYAEKDFLDLRRLDPQVGLPEALAQVVGSRPPTDRARLKIEGVARSTPDILEYTAAMENSPLVDKARVEIRGLGVWAGKQVQRFELVCELYKQENARP